MSRSGDQQQRGAAFWPIVAVVLTSALWAAILVALRAGSSSDDAGYSSASPDLRGYHIVDSPCRVGDFTVMGDRFRVASGGVSRMQITVSRHDALDTARCLVDLVSEKTKGLLTTVAAVHKQSNPISSFRAGFDTAELDGWDGASAEGIEKVPDLGDEAYIVSGGSNGSRATLRIRDGWFTYELTWQSVGGDGFSKDNRRQFLTSYAADTLPRYRQ
ncbi:hypothetical protein LTV02_26900 [Nocardia yamanashiensis]|uniref:hypothetical protein n=1 Tax=Nocardia yamanashiensis TaxID=209247 RepID=UPI001E520A9E|nr:hypothetical protein [Nocardia yamanashiensis]UGT39670.1 hypothetical protein LTV02_26900 [Nocardia yamanashiensis]